MLLRAALSERSRLYGGLKQAVARGRSAFADRFAERAKELVTRAQEICREVGSAEVTPAHVMLAMLEDDVLCETLERRGITEEAVRAVLPSGPRREGPALVSAETRRMLEQALLQALGLQPQPA